MPTFWLVLRTSIWFPTPGFKIHSLHAGAAIFDMGRFDSKIVVRLLGLICCIRQYFWPENVSTLNRFFAVVL